MFHFSGFPCPSSCGGLEVEQWSETELYLGGLIPAWGMYDVPMDPLCYVHPGNELCIDGCQAVVHINYSLVNTIHKQLRVNNNQITCNLYHVFSALRVVSNALNIINKDCEL